MNIESGRSGKGQPLEVEYKSLAQSLVLHRAIHPHRKSFSVHWLHLKMSTLDLKNVQGDILLDGLPKRVESFFFFQIADGHIKDFCRSLKQVSKDIAHVDNTAHMRQDIGEGKTTRKEGDLVEMAGANIAFSWKGLQRVHVSRVSIFAMVLTNPDGHRSCQGHWQPCRPGLHRRHEGTCDWQYSQLKHDWRPHQGRYE